jgi:CRISPR/Cas system-associated endonuclease Cas3-HD
MSRFRQKVIQLVIVERKSVYEAAIRCGCSADKVKRVLKKWRVLSRLSQQELSVSEQE